MRASRLVSIVLLLQARGRMTAGQLADALEVSVRTVYRDIGALSGAGVPVYGDAGPAGGYQLVDGYRTRLTGLTAAEAEALPLAGLPAAAAELGLGPAVAAAQLKLQAALPDGLRDRSAAISERFHLDAPGWYADGDPSPHLAAVADAVWNQRRIEVLYRRWAEPTDVIRTLDPHGLVLKGGKWYAVAAADGRPEMRTFRVSQILSLTPLAQTFERVPGFRLGAYWAASISEFRAGLQQGEAVIRLSPAGRERLARLLSPAVRDAVDATAGPPDRDGWVTAVVPVESPGHAEAEFLRLGADVEVTGPPALRQRLAATAAALARMYAGPGAESAGPAGGSPGGWAGGWEGESGGDVLALAEVGAERLRDGGQDGVRGDDQAELAVAVQ